MNRKIPLEKKILMKNLLEIGWNQTEIANRFQVSRKVVYNIAKKIADGLPLDSPSNCKTSIDNKKNPKKKKPKMKKKSNRAYINLDNNNDNNNDNCNVEADVGHDYDLEQDSNLNCNNGNDTILINEDDSNCETNNYDNHFDNGQETDELLDLLSRYDLQMYYPKLMELRIFVDTLKFITESDIHELFDADMGARIKFRGLINECKRLHNIEPVSSSELLELLTQQNLQMYFHKLRDQNIDIDCFKFITDSDIKELFDVDIGGRIKFRGFILEWRKLNNMEPLASCCSGCCCCSSKTKNHNFSHISTSMIPVQNTITTDDTRRSSFVVETISPEYNNNALSPSSLMYDDTQDATDCTNNGYKFNMDNFLKSDVARELLRKYEKYQTFHNTERDILMTSIVKEHLDRRVSMTLVTLDDIANEIVKKFTNESKEFYFRRIPRIGGKLYNKYRSMLGNYRNAGLFSHRLRKPPTSRTKSLIEPELILSYTED